jgi:hypothetical protein
VNRTHQISAQASVSCRRFWRQEPVKVSTLREYERAIRQFTSTTRRRKSARL